MKYSKENLIIESVFLKDDENENKPCNVYLDSMGIFHVIGSDDSKRTFHLTKPFVDIQRDNKSEILAYRGINQTELLHMDDIFLHGKFVKEILTK